jgi:catechol 2,3-dioxygenase-like lactoylglutathione lyase family enzyme
VTHPDDRTLNLVRLMIAVLCAAAFLLIALILNGSGVDETSGRALGMAISVAFFSLTGVAGTNLANRRPEMSALGYATALVSGAALLAMFATIWSDDFQDDNWRLTADLTLVALAGGHASLLLGSARPEDSDAVRLVRIGVLSAIGILLAMAIAEISSPGEDLGWEPFGVLAVLYLLGTLVLPLLRRVPSAASGAPAAAGRVPLPPPTPGGEFGNGAALRIDRVAIAVTDRARSDHFYREVLGAEIVPAAYGGVAYRIGSQQLVVREADRAGAQPGAAQVHPGSSELCLVWDGPAQAAVERLTGFGVAVIRAPAPSAGAHGLGISVHCRDPDGSLIELISYT